TLPGPAPLHRGRRAPDAPAGRHHRHGRGRPAVGRRLLAPARRPRPGARAPGVPGVEPLRGVRRCRGPGACGGLGPGLATRTSASRPATARSAPSVWGSRGVIGGIDAHGPLLPELRRGRREKPAVTTQGGAPTPLGAPLTLVQRRGTVVPGFVPQ